MSRRDRMRSRDPLPPIMRHASRSAGKPLDPGTRAWMEPRFRHDFSGVRVHSDGAAAESARALNASAFTLGRDVYFGQGRYEPESSAGRKLLAHELTHVVQQEGVSPNLQASSVVPVHSPAEREAESASTAVAEGHAIAGSISCRTPGMVQRSVLGDIGGTLLGGGIGALVGFALGGPIGAIIGGLLGGVAGLAIGDAESAEKRGLTSQEQTEAELVFGNSLDYGSVHIAEAPIMAIGDIARTPFDTIYFPPGTNRMPFSDFMPWLIHELAHCWQYQHGISVVTKLFWALHGAKAYVYGGEAALIQAKAQGKHFTDFNTEQQGDILRDYYVRLKAGQDTSAWDPFVAEVKNGGRATAMTGPESRRRTAEA